MLDPTAKSGDMAVTLFPGSNWDQAGLIFTSTRTLTCTHTQRFKHTLFTHAWPFLTTYPSLFPLLFLPASPGRLPEPPPAAVSLRFSLGVRSSFHSTT